MLHASRSSSYTHNQCAASFPGTFQVEVQHAATFRAFQCGALEAALAAPGSPSPPHSIGQEHLQSQHCQRATARACL